MKSPKIDFPLLVLRLDAILARGLSHGLGVSGGQVCVEAAICEALDLPHGDDPKCVAPAVRAFKIALNDSSWSSPKARAKGLRALAIAQLGTLDVVDNIEFSRRLAEKTIRVLLPEVWKTVRPESRVVQAVALRCELEGTEAAAEAAAGAAAEAAGAAGVAQVGLTDKFLNLSASLALEVLRELNAPGIAFLDEESKNV